MSELARALIAQEKKDKTGILDLGNCGLTNLELEVPELFELVDLEELTISNRYNKSEKRKIIRSNNNLKANVINEISYLFLQLKNLKKLRIAGDFDSRWKISKLENLPENISQLEIGFNKIRKLENLPKSMRQLDISQNQISKLKNLPESLNQLGIN